VKRADAATPSPEAPEPSAATVAGLLAPAADGTGWIVPVRAQPKARRAEVVGLHGAAVKIAVTAPPDKGRANEALLDLASAAWNLKRSQVALRTGATSPHKTLLVTGIGRDDLAARIAASVRHGG
jgi:uncharacterized protein (TIGR00251 family)